MRRVPSSTTVTRARLTTVTLALIAAGACGGEDERPVPPPDASTYAAALAHFLPPPVEGEQPNVFVTALDQPLALEEQVAVIDALGDDYDVKFVDEAEAVIDAGVEGRPPVDDGLLLGVGTIPSEPPYVTRVEAYRGESDVDAKMVTLAWRTDHWAVADEEDVESEAFVPTE
jgi:hypothetical protein